MPNAQRNYSFSKCCIIAEMASNNIYSYTYFRAGRCRPGICYHMFSSARYEAMLEFQLPEILRYPLQVS